MKDKLKELLDSVIRKDFRSRILEFFERRHGKYAGTFCCVTPPEVTSKRVDLVNMPDPVLTQKLHEETVARIKASPIAAGFDVYNEDLDGLWKDYVLRTAAKLARIDPKRLSWNDEDKMLLDGEVICKDRWLYHPMAMEWDYYPVRNSPETRKYDISNMANYYAEHIKDRTRKNDK